ncbi:MAG: sel1 repeat family protein [Alphaproteobacteria bacterium]|nr:MAG: sel1 repeat family protein [Alphaproteobacteria bacterium]
MTAFRKLLISVGLFCIAALMHTVAFAGAFEDGKAAYDKKDYGAAQKIWQPLADQGDAAAQFWIGLMHQNGSGVAQDYAEAMKWHRLAADQGYSAAQISVGMMYSEGKGVAQDAVQAYKWLSLVADKPDADPGDKQVATLFRGIGTTKMTPEHVAEGKRLAAEWKPVTK